MVTRIDRLASATALGSVFLAMSGTAAAQAVVSSSPPPSPVTTSPPPSDDNGDIIVTGSRIRTRDYVANSPIATVSAEAFRTTGPANVETLLNQMPQFVPSFTSTSNNPSNRGRATLDLRGLGSDRTLVLQDGHRILESATDVSVIPTLLIENVEVITGGASAAYGSDAIAGVVNFRLKRNFTGLTLDGQAGISARGDSASYKVGAAAGVNFADDRGNAVLSVEYFNRRRTPAGSRGFATRPLPTTNGPRGAYQPTGANLPTQAAVDGVFAGYGVAAGSVGNTSSLLFNDDNTLFTSNGGAFNYRAPATASEFTRDGTYFYNPDLDLALQLPQDRVTAFGRVSFDVADDIAIYAEAAYTNYSADSFLAPAVSSGAGLSVPVANPFIPADLGTILASRPTPGANFVAQRRFTEVGPRLLTNDTEFYQIGGGIDGKIPSLGLSWNIYAGSSRQTTDYGSINTLSRSAISRLLTAADGGVSLCAGGFDIFGANGISPACADYIRRSTSSRERSRLDQIEATVQGSLFKLPGGDVKFALGADYRASGLTVDVDPVLTSGDLLGFGSADSSRSRQNVKEVYAELLLPLLRDLPFAHELSVSLGYRYSDYNILAKGVSSYKAEGNWSPIDGFRVRGGYQRAIRVPPAEALVEGQQINQQPIGSPTLTGTGGDPCDTRSFFRTGADAGRVSALCMAQGVPQQLLANYNFGNTIVPNLVGGNPGLRPETADTYSVGLVIAPKFSSPLLSGLTASVDYYNISISGSFGSVSAPGALASCFNADGSNPDYSASNFYCSLITRDAATGNISEIRSIIQNLGSTKLAGVDTTVNWRIPVSLGIGGGNESVTLNTVVSYLEKYEIQDLINGPVLDYAGSIGSSPGTAQAKWKAVTNIRYDSDSVSLGVQWRHIGALRDASLIGAGPEVTAVSPPAVDYFDLLTSVRVGKDLELRFVVNNLFDKQPPFYTSFAQFRTDPSTYDVLGRRFSVGVTSRF